MILGYFPALHDPNKTIEARGTAASKDKST